MLLITPSFVFLFKIANIPLLANFLRQKFDITMPNFGSVYPLYIRKVPKILFLPKSVLSIGYSGVFSQLLVFRLTRDCYYITYITQLGTDLQGVPVPMQSSSLQKPPKVQIDMSKLKIQTL